MAEYRLIRRDDAYEGVEGYVSTAYNTRRGVGARVEEREEACRILAERTVQLQLWWVLSPEATVM